MARELKNKRLSVGKAKTPNTSISGGRVKEN